MNSRLDKIDYLPDDLCLTTKKKVMNRFGTISKKRYKDPLIVPKRFITFFMIVPILISFGKL